MALVPPQPSILDALAGAFASSGVDPRAWALGFARAIPTVTLVPAFGLSAVPVQTRLVLGLSLGLCLAPALAARADTAGWLVVAIGREALVGLPVALMAAFVTYVAAMAGGLVDDLRGTKESVTLPALPEQLPPVAVLFALLSTIAFLETGGAARVASALSSPLLAARFSWPALAQAFAASVELAFAIAAPLAVACVLLEIGSALIARAATPAFVGPVLAPLKSVLLLGVLALVFERIAELLAIVARTYP
jgi:type III secretory pathway component EscT